MHVPACLYPQLHSSTRLMGVPPGRALWVQAVSEAAGQAQQLAQENAALRQQVALLRERQVGTHGGHFWVCK